MPDGPKTIWVVPENVTEEQIAEARRALEDLGRVLARASADASYKMGVRFDVEDPQVARDLMMATLEGLVCSKPRPDRKKAKSAEPEPG